MASTEEKPTNGKPKQKAKSDKKPKCGIVMPISDMDGYTAQHWADVLDILTEVADAAGFDVDLVSNANDATFIHKTIIQNLDSNEIVICDVSGKNPNVMFELGIRLTFDKPTVIIKDDTTDYSFDTAIIEHVPYPKDLHYQTILIFKEKLKSKIAATLEKFTNDRENASFLRHFGIFTVTGLETKELSTDKFIVEKLEELTKEVLTLRNESRQQAFPQSSGFLPDVPSVRIGKDAGKAVRFTLRAKKAQVESMRKHFKLLPIKIRNFSFEELGEDEFTLTVFFSATVFTSVLTTHIMDLASREGVAEITRI